MATPLIHLSKSEQRSLLIGAIEQWIRQSPYEELSFSQIAQSLHMSPRTLRRHLKNHDLCYKELVKVQRKKQATEMIESGNYSLEQIGEHLGYRDASSFSRAFKSWYGMPPTLYQKQRAWQKVRERQKSELGNASKDFETLIEIA